MVHGGRASSSPIAPQGRVRLGRSHVGHANCRDSSPPFERELRVGPPLALGVSGGGKLVAPDECAQAFG